MTNQIDQPKGRAGNYSYKKGPKGLFWFWWLVAFTVFVVTSLPWIWKQIHWRALLVSSAIFIAMMFAGESLALHYGWWVWNEHQLLGPKVFLIPIEEFLAYFIIIPFMVVIQTFVNRIIINQKSKEPKT